jgi:hypothetical protein
MSEGTIAVSIVGVMLAAVLTVCVLTHTGHIQKVDLLQKVKLKGASAVRIGTYAMPAAPTPVQRIRAGEQEYMNRMFPESNPPTLAQQTSVRPGDALDTISSSHLQSLDTITASHLVALETL